MKPSLFELGGKAVVVTGAGGLLGRNHVSAIAAAGGRPIAVDIEADRLASLSDEFTSSDDLLVTIQADVTIEEEVTSIAEGIQRDFGPVWGLVNNVAANPAMVRGNPVSRLESTPVNSWEDDLRLGLTSAWLCGRAFGAQMAANGGGSIVNIASDLALIAPDQRIYRHDAGIDVECPMKPASYSATKGGLRMLSKYFATYWSPVPVRSNCLMPGSVYALQSAELVHELESRIPLHRLAAPSEYQGAIIFLLSEASSYMTGSDLVIDGGRSAW